MWRERKRKWVLALVGLVLVAIPATFFNHVTLDAIQAHIRDAASAGKTQAWMPRWQIRVAHIYAGTFRDVRAASAYEQYYRFFYASDRDSADTEARNRAKDMIWDYSTLLLNLDRRSEQCYYLRVLLRDWEDHPWRQAAERRERDLTHSGDGNWKPVDEP